MTDITREADNRPDAELIEELVARYTADPVPPCRVCGGELSIQSCGGGRATVWGCGGMEPDPGRPGFLRYRTGRTPADDHYSRSTWTQYRGGDSDVVELARRFRAAIARAEAAESELAKMRGPTTGYYIACFKGGSRGYVCWWGPNDHGYTNDLGAAGVYENPIPRYHDSGDDNVPVPVAFAHKLAARRMVDVGDSGNECMWSAATLRTALAKEADNGS